MRYKVSINKKVLLSALSLSLGLSASQVLANTETTQFEVKLQIVAACKIGMDSANELNFGQHGLDATSDLNKETSLNVTCTNGVAYKIGLDAGVNAGGAANDNNRRMKGVESSISNESIAYDLYKTSSRTERWGFNEGFRVVGTGTGASQTHTIYGQVKSSALKNAAIGNYKDTVTATVYF